MTNEFYTQGQAAQMAAELAEYKQAEKDAAFQSVAADTGQSIITKIQPYLKDGTSPQEIAELLSGEVGGEEGAALEKRGLLNDANNDRIKELQAKLIETEQLARSTGSADLRVQASTIRRELADLQ